MHKELKVECFWKNLKEELCNRNSDMADMPLLKVYQQVHHWPADFYLKTFDMQEHS